MNQLSEAQRRAASHVDGPMLVLAGPVLFQIISSNVCEELDILCINMEHYRVTRNLSTKVEKSV